MKLLPAFIIILLLAALGVYVTDDLNNTLTIVMRIILFFVVMAICYYLYSKSKQDKADAEFERINGNASPAEKPNSREHVMQALNELGCQPKIDDDNAILVNYQGETFRIEADDNYKGITIYDPWWGWLELNNDNTEKLKEAVNKCNMGNCIPTMLYTVNGDRIGIHCKLNLHFVDKEDRYSGLLAAYFKTFFDAHEMFRNLFNNEIKTEQEKKPRKIIKGFSQ